MNNKTKSSAGREPYFYQKAIFFLNRRCTVGCASCNAAAAARNRGELTPGWLNDFFNKARESGLPFPNYVLWTGGEPFSSFESLLTGVGLASRCGYHSEILTSGSWFESHPGYLERLAAAGTFSLRISLDAEHQESVPMSRIFALIEQALKLKRVAPGAHDVTKRYPGQRNRRIKTRFSAKSNIEVNFTLREVPGRKSPGDYIKEIEKALPEFYRRNHGHSRWLHIIPHIPVTPAGVNGTPCSCVSLPAHVKWRRRCSQGFKDLVVGEDGFVYPCCGLFSLSCYPRLRVGDPLQESLDSLSTKYYREPLFRVLKEKGPYHICRELGLQPETWAWPTYQSPCHLCLALFYYYGDRVLRYYERP